MNKRKALGKGLSSLIPEAPALTSPGILQLDVGIVSPNPGQPRKSFDDEALEELSRSIGQHGVLQPVVVSREGERYRLIVGERRWRAAVKAGLKKIPAVLRDQVDDGQRLEMALVENLQRQELNPLEEARAYKMLVQDFGLEHKEVARRVGKSRSYVSNILRINNLSDNLQTFLEAGRLTVGHARALAGVEDRELQERLGRRILDRSLSVRQTEKLVQRALGAKEDEEPGTGSVFRKDPNVRAAEDRLKRALGTKVEISGGPDRGRIEIHYVSSKELDRLFDTLVGVARRAPAPPAAGLELPGGSTERAG